MSHPRSIDIWRCSQRSWEEVAKKVKRSIVFIDDASAECLHWQGGAMFLFNAGAMNIKEFSSFECGGKNEKKAVFVISGPLKGTNSQILQDILEGSQFEYIIVISSLSPAMHTLIEFGAVDDEYKYFHHLEDKILGWAGNANYTAEINYIPVVTAALNPNLFVLPSHSTLFPLLPTDLHTLQNRIQPGNGDDPLHDLDFGHLPRETQLRMKLLVNSLNSHLENLEIAEDCFSLGYTSRIVATELANLGWAKNRRKNSTNKAALLLIDRSLDLASVIGHHFETLFDKMVVELSHLPGHHNDLCVNMAPLCSVPSNVKSDVIVPGCLAHPLDSHASHLLKTIMTAKHKESIMEVNRQIVEAASKENLPIKLTGKPGRVTAEQLESHISLFKGKTASVKRHSGSLQIIQACIEALKKSTVSKLDSLLGVEKGLLQCLGDSESKSAMHHITETLNGELGKPANERQYNLHDIFTLLVYVYSLVGSECTNNTQEERRMQSLLVGAILEENDENMPEFLRTLVGPNQKSESKISMILEGLFHVLNQLGDARKHLKIYSNTFKPGGMTSQACLDPICKQVMDDILNPDKPELVDIEYKSGGFGNLLKSGFGFFRNVSKPRPSDHQTLILFVIGGITTTEIRQIQDIVAARKSSVQVVIGSTSLLNSSDILERVLVQNNLHPDAS